MQESRVLLGVDGSPGAARAVQWCAQHAMRTHAEVIAAYVLTYSDEFVRDLPPTGMTTWRTRMREELEGAWTEPLRQLGISVRCVLQEDDSVEQGLLRLAESEGVDLIVLGAHGHGNLSDRLLGAVTYRVSHRARHPVVIVPADWTSSVPSASVRTAAVVDAP